MKLLNSMLLKKLSLGKRFAVLLLLTSMPPLALLAGSAYLIHGFLVDAEDNYSVSKGYDGGSHFVSASEAYFRFANLYLLETVLGEKPKWQAIDEKRSAIEAAAKAFSDELAKSRNAEFRKYGKEFTRKWRDVNPALENFVTHVAEGMSVQQMRTELASLRTRAEALKDLVNFIDDKFTDAAEANYREAAQTEQVLLWVGVSTFFAILAIFLFNYQLLFNGVLVTLRDLAEALQMSARQLTKESYSVSDNSETLARAASEQASSLQETVAAIDEISAMVERNAESANKSSMVSQKSESNAEQGRAIVTQMIESIEQISSSSDEIAEQIEASNNEISEIVRLISEIGEKTKVINDIVFQTKLLSFNASVEAARAGEHGRGFAIVAEEVGNLAAVSGKAANEISSMLSQSISQVNSIIKNSRERIERLMKISTDKVQAGTETAALCGSALEEIRTDVTQVNRMVKEISTASQEQARGVQEITKAMTRLDQLTQENASLATNSSSTAEELKLQAEYITEIIDNLARLIQGLSQTSTAANQNSFGGSGGMSASGKSHDAGHQGSSISGKILPFSTAKNARGASGTESLDPGFGAKAQSGQGFARAASGDSHIPDKDDPRFQDI